MGACSRARAGLRGVGSTIAGMVVRRDCWAASWAMRRQRSTRLAGGLGEVLLGAAG